MLCLSHMLRFSLLSFSRNVALASLVPRHQGASAVEGGGEGGRRNIITDSVGGEQVDGDIVIMAVIPIEVIVMETTTTPGTTIRHMIGEEAIADQASLGAVQVLQAVRVVRAAGKCRLFDILHHYRLSV